MIILECYKVLIFRLMGGKLPFYDSSDIENYTEVSQSVFVFRCLSQVISRVAVDLMANLHLQVIIATYNSCFTMYSSMC